MFLAKRIIYYLNLLKLKIKGYEILIPPPGLGDILYILCCLKHHFDEKKYVMIINKKYFIDLVELFPGVIDKVILVEKLYNESQLLKNWYQKNNKHFILNFSKKLKTTIDTNNHLKVAHNNKISNLFYEFNLIEGKTVLLCPESNSCHNEISKEYWIKYADKLKNLGYTPIFNSKNKYADFQNIFLNIKDTILFVNLAGYVIGYRSGLCDVLMYFCNVKAIFLYPNILWKGHAKYIENFNNNPAQKYLAYCSLKYIYPQKDIQEFLFQNDKFPIFTNTGNPLS